MEGGRECILARLDLLSLLSSSHLRRECRPTETDVTGTDSGWASKRDVGVEKNPENLEEDLELVTRSLRIIFLSWKS